MDTITSTDSPNSVDGILAYGEPSKKRARSNTGGKRHHLDGNIANETVDTMIDTAIAAKDDDNTIPAYDIEAALRSFEPETLVQLLTEHAIESAVLAQRIRRRYHTAREAEAHQVIDFSVHSKAIWREINVRYKGMPNSRQFDISGDVFWKVHNDIKSIADSVHEHSPFDTKRNALETLRKIGKTVCLSGDTLGHEIRKMFGADEVLQRSMHHVVGTMTDEERVQMCYDDGGNGGASPQRGRQQQQQEQQANLERSVSGPWTNQQKHHQSFIYKFRELINLGESYAIYENLHGVLHRLQRRAKRHEHGHGHEDENEDSEADSHLDQEETESEDELPDPGDYE